jgi:hypothetical protein
MQKYMRILFSIDYSLPQRLKQALLQLILYDVPSCDFHHIDGDLLLVLLSIGPTWGIHLHEAPSLHCI